MTKPSICVALGLAALLAACGGRDRLPPVTVVKTVDRPVAVACLKQNQRPTPPRRLSEDSPLAPPSLTEAVARFRAKLVEWARYGRKADGLLRACEKLSP